MSQPPGWYPDPLGGSGARYWDGARWDGATDASPPPAEEFPEPLPVPDKPRGQWPVWVGIGVAVATAVASAVFVLTRPAGTANVTPAAPLPPARSSAMSTPTTTASTTQNTDELVRRVKAMMQDKFDTDPELKKVGLKVIDIVLVHKTGNEYRGTATISGPGGTLQTTIDVTADGTSTMWEIDSSKLNFTPTPTAAPPPAAKPDGAEDFNICPSGLSGAATDDTSCAFADSVRESWRYSTGNTVIAYSPVTNQEYMMHCTLTPTNVWARAMRCVGKNAQGTPLVVYISVG